MKYMADSTLQESGYGDKINKNEDSASIPDYRRNRFNFQDSCVNSNLPLDVTSFKSFIQPQQPTGGAP